MSYTVISFDGNITIQPETVDNTTPLSLPGKDYSGWGEPYSNNFEHLLENFAYTQGSPPSGVRTGMLWYNTTTSNLELYDARSGWKNIGDSANKLSTPRNIALSGAVAGSALFDGSSDINISTALQPNGATPGTYYLATITIDATGRVTGASTNYNAQTVVNATEVTSFNTRIGSITLTAQDVINALGYTPTNGGITNITASTIDNALGFVPANSASVLYLSGGTMSGSINMGGSAITNVGAPSGPNAAARLTDVQSAAGNKTQRIYNGTGETSYNVTVSTSPPSGGNDGDVWYVY
jgi:hypothetical protein